MLCVRGGDTKDTISMQENTGVECLNVISGKLSTAAHTHTAIAIHVRTLATFFLPKSLAFCYLHSRPTTILRPFKYKCTHLPNCPCASHAAHHHFFNGQILLSGTALFLHFYTHTYYIRQVNFQFGAKKSHLKSCRAAKTEWLDADTANHCYPFCIMY